MARFGGLRSAAEFSRVYENGRRGRSDGVAVSAVARRDHAPTRVGLAVPRGAGTAVARNRTKRRLRAILRAAAPPHGYDIVCRTLPEASDLAFQELEEHVGNALTGSLGARG